MDTLRGSSRQSTGTRPRAHTPRRSASQRRCVAGAVVLLLDAGEQEDLVVHSPLRNRAHGPLSMWGELAPPTAPQQRLCHGPRVPPPLGGGPVEYSGAELVAPRDRTAP